jgi:hypothetical protein
MQEQTYAIIGREHYFGAPGQTDVYAGALLVLLLAVLLLWVLPRRYCFIPLLVAAIFIPSVQVVIVSGLHLTLTRILIGSAWLRLLWMRFGSGGPSMPRWQTLDSLMLAFYAAGAITFPILWGDSGALVNRLGLMYNAFGIYFFMRYVLRDAHDLDRLAKTFAWLLVIVAVFMAAEQLTGRNAFSVFGGVYDFTQIRDGRLRSQGPFAHPLTAGAVGATLFPLMLGLWWQGRKNRISALLGASAALVIVVSSMASTSFLALAAGIFALGMWPLRRYLSWFRWGTVATLVALHMVMKAPVWALIARIDLTGSSSGYHRYLLVDQFIRRFGEWWMLGTRHTAQWGFDMWDTANYYVTAGTEGGLIGLALFLAILWVSFRGLGRARRAFAAEPEHARRLWVLGAMLFAHAVAFFGIGYFDQSSLLWYAELAMIAVAVSLRPVAVASAAVAASTGSLLPPLQEEQRADRQDAALVLVP